MSYELQKMVQGVNYDTTTLKNNVNGLIDLANVISKPQTPIKYNPFGDSFTAAVAGFATWFSASSGSELIQGENFGVGGNTTQAMLDRIDDIPNERSLSTVLETANDASQGVTPIQHAINMKQILTTLIDKGVTPVMVLGSPKDNETHTNLISEYNAYDWVTCKDLGVMCFNPWVGMSDGLGFWAGGLSEDGIHPSAQTYYDSGVKLWQAYNSMELAPPANNNNNFGLLNNPLFIDGASGTPSGWIVAGTTNRALTQTELGEGNTFTLEGDAFSFFYSLFQATNGKRYFVSIKASSDIVSADNSGKLDIYIQAPSGARTYLLQSSKLSFEKMTFTKEFLCTEDGDHRLNVSLNGTTFNFTASFAQAQAFCIDDYTI